MVNITNLAREIVKTVLVVSLPNGMAS